MCTTSRFSSPDLRRGPVILLALCGLLTACGGGGGGSSATTADDAPAAQPAPPPAVEEAFDLNAFTTFRLDLTVLLDGDPYRHARVSIEDPRMPPAPGEELEDTTSGGHYFNGATRAGGELSTTLRVPTRVGGIDVIVHVPRTTGPYTYPSLRDLWGPTAPSSRVHVSWDDLSDDIAQAHPLTIELRSR